MSQYSTTAESYVLPLLTALDGAKVYIRYVFATVKQLLSANIMYQGFVKIAKAGHILPSLC